MKLELQGLFVSMLLFMAGTLTGQEEPMPQNETTDIVWLKDGSRLTGTILKWDLDRGMEFKLLTGAVIVINKSEIKRVTQDIPMNSAENGLRSAYVKEPRLYAFREEGWYQTTSAFINTSLMGGAGIHHAMGFRFSRMLGVGLGIGIESNDFDRYRNIIPVYAELRGFLLSKKITPYYALKLGYGFALNDPANGTIAARGGIHFSPELGVRFGGAEVNYYFGMQYKIQNATFTSDDWWGGGTLTDRISYRRVEFRTGILF